MSKWLEIFLGILTAMGGFVEVGELTFMLNAGQQFDYRLLWVVAIGTLGIIVYGEISGRIAAVRGQPVFNVIRERAGLRLGALTLVSSLLVCLLTCAAEIGAIAMLWEFMGGWPYRGMILLALLAFLAIVWTLSFKAIERVFGLLGLLLVVVAVAAWQMRPDEAQMAAGLVPSLPPTDKTLYAYFAVALISSIMLPYETYFYASGAIEDAWTPGDVRLNRVIVIIGFTLGSLLAVSLMVLGAEYFGPRGIEATLPGTATLAVGSALGKVGVVFLLGGMCFAFAGAAIETALCCAYNLSQFFGWPWGKHRPPREAPRFVIAWIVTFVLAAAIVLTGVDPIRVVEYSIVFSVVILPLTYFPLMAISRDEAVMGVYANGWLSNTLGWFYFVLISIAAVAAIPLLILTHGGEG
jgi:manganese transport protein